MLGNNAPVVYRPPPGSTSKEAPPPYSSPVAAYTAPNKAATTPIVSPQQIVVNGITYQQSPQVGHQAPAQGQQIGQQPTGAMMYHPPPPGVQPQQPQLQHAPSQQFQPMMPGQTPMMMPAQTPMMTPAQTPMMVPAQTPMMQGQTPMMMQGQAPMMMQGQAPMMMQAQTLRPMLVQVPAQTPQTSFVQVMQSPPPVVQVQRPTTVITQQITPGIVMQYKCKDCGSPLPSANAMCRKFHAGSSYSLGTGSAKASLGFGSNKVTTITTNSHGQSYKTVTTVGPKVVVAPQQQVISIAQVAPPPTQVMVTTTQPQILVQPQPQVVYMQAQSTANNHGTDSVYYNGAGRIHGIFATRPPPAQTTHIIQSPARPRPPGAHQQHHHHHQHQQHPYHQQHHHQQHQHQHQIDVQYQFSIDGSSGGDAGGQSYFTADQSQGDWVQQGLDPSTVDYSGLAGGGDVSGMFGGGDLSGAMGGMDLSGLTGGADFSGLADLGGLAGGLDFSGVEF